MRRRLRPKAAALLEYLIARGGEVVTPEETFAALWPGVRVGSGVLKVYVWEIRNALGDRRRAARFLETIPRRGYRWIAPVVRLSHGIGTGAGGASSGDSAPLLVGRERELLDLERSLDRALAASRQVVFVTGEAGIGKTVLVEELVRRAAARPGVRVAQGRCVELYGAGEPYLPVLSALGDLGRGESRRALVAALRRHAPTWLAQLPSLRSRREPGPSPPSAAASQKRMLREIAEALEAFTARRGLVLVLEDLHWSDSATLDLLSLLALRSGPARLLLVVTHRPGEGAVGRNRPASAGIDEVLARFPSAELALSFLAPADVAAYLRLRFSSLRDPGALEEIAQTIHRRTDGNPLFMANLVDDLLATAAGGDDRPGAPSDLAERAHRVLPADLRKMIERRVERLDPEDQLLLEVASAAGARFSAAAVAEVLDAPVAVVEQRCARLGRASGFLAPAGSEEWQDGTEATCFTFVHSLYERVLYERLTAARRRELHRRIGERMERSHGPRAGEIAAELAMHFERGRDDERAVRYLEIAAERASAKHANVEAARHFARAIELLGRLPVSAARNERELALQLRLGAPSVMVRGYTAPEVEAVYARALELSRLVGESPQLLIALVGLYRFALVRSEFRAAKDLGEQALRLARASRVPIASLAAHLMLGVSCFGLGDFSRARRHLEQGLSLYDPEQHRFVALSFGDDPGAVCRAEMANTLWFLGYPDQALRHAEDAVRCARGVGIPYSLAFALNYLVWSRLLRREGRLGRAPADELVKIAVENDFAYWVAQGTAIRGWVRIEEGDVAAGIAEIRAGLAAYRAIGASVVLPWHLGRLAEAYAQIGADGEARDALDEAFDAMGRKEERFYEAELHRLRGELALGTLGKPGLALATPGVGEIRDGDAAEECFQRAIEIARRQRAKSLELRAVISLARLRCRQGERTLPWERLRATYRWFREGFATGDLEQARALLALSAR